MLLEGLYGAIGEIDATLDSMGLVDSSKKVSRSGDDVPAELVGRAQLEGFAWGSEFEGTRRVSQSYADAQQELGRTLMQVREDLVALATEMKKADEDLQRTDDESGRAFERLSARVKQAGHEPRTTGEG